MPPYPKMRCALLILVVFLFYIPFASNNFNTVDDKKAVNSLINSCNNKINYTSIFFPTKKPYYYRPLLWTTFILDYKIHLCSPYLMHLENIIIHAFNVLFIFFISRLLFTSEALAFLNSIIFAIHPINTEAINWISARTDLLAGFFCFLAFLCLIQYKNYLGIFLSSLGLLLGLLCKESAIGFLPFAFIFTLYLYRKDFLLKHRVFFVVIFVLSLSCYFFMRYPELRFWYKDINNETLETIIPKGIRQVTPTPLWYQIGVFFKVIGFYFKKLLIPWPLNFAIVKINKTLYLFFGIFIFIIISILFLKEKKLFCLGLIWSLCFMLIAVLVPLRRLAWTPLAERYVYISSLGIAIFITTLFIKLQSINYKKWIYPIFISYIFIFAISTAYRNYLWQDNYRLYLDTIKKSPDFGPAYNELAISLLNKGKPEEAKKYFKIAYKLTQKDPYNYLTQLNLLLLEQEKLPVDKVINKYEKLFNQADKRKIKIDILKKAIRYLEVLRIDKKVDKKMYPFLYKKEIYFLKKLANFEDAPFCYYRIGQLYLGLNNKQKAAYYFKNAYKLAPTGAFFKEPALKLYNKLNN